MQPWYYYSLLFTCLTLHQNNSYLQLPALIHLISALNLMWVLQNLLLQNELARAGVKNKCFLMSKSWRKSSAASPPVRHLVCTTICQKQVKTFTWWCISKNSPISQPASWHLHPVSVVRCLSCSGAPVLGSGPRYGQVPQGVKDPTSSGSEPCE